MDLREIWHGVGDLRFFCQAKSGDSRTENRPVTNWNTGVPTGNYTSKV